VVLPGGGAILDPFAGGSVRGLVAGNGGYRYTGVDLSPDQVDANEDQAADWATRDLLAAEPQWLLGDAADVLPSLQRGAYDYVFTCPPYHNLEKYSDHPADLSAMRWKEFAEVYREIIAESVRCLAEDRFATWVVGEVRNSAGALRNLVPLTIAAHEDAGARHYNDAVLMTPSARCRCGWATSGARAARWPPSPVRAHLHQGRPQARHRPSAWRGRGVNGYELLARALAVPDHTPP